MPAQAATPEQIERAEKINAMMPMMLGVFAMASEDPQSDLVQIDMELAADALAYMTAMILEANPQLENAGQQRKAAAHLHDQVLARLRAFRTITEQTGTPMIERFTGLMKDGPASSIN